MKKYNKVEILGSILILIALLLVFKLVGFLNPFSNYASVIGGVGGAIWAVGCKQKKKTLKENKKENF